MVSRISRYPSPNLVSPLFYTEHNGPSSRLAGYYSLTLLLLSQCLRKMHLSDEIIRTISSYYVSGPFSWRVLLIQSSLSTPSGCRKLQTNILYSFCDSLAFMGKCSSLTRNTWSVLLLLAPIFPLEGTSILRKTTVTMVLTSLSGEYLSFYNLFRLFQGRLLRLSAFSQPGNERFLVPLCSICARNSNWLCRCTANVNGSIIQILLTRWSLIPLA